jgi:3-hydroxyisobutyrate dehydrogenase
MALNLFAKTYLAYHQSTSLPDPPEFLICEADPARAEAFLDALKQKGGQELRSRANIVGSGKEHVDVYPYR